MKLDNNISIMKYQGNIGDRNIQSKYPSECQSDHFEGYVTQTGRSKIIARL